MPDRMRLDLTARLTETVTADVTKLCPVKDETDTGTVTITYVIRGEAFELHALRTYLDTFADRRISHEDFTAEVAQTLNVDVVSSWVTAGMEVTCAVVRESEQG